MTEARSVSAAVEVPVDPATAFTAFTDELDLWWVRGPINYFDAARAVAMVCEPGVGGRLIEVYDAATGEGLELGRITVWEPGSRLSWTSSVDDVEIDVRFVPFSSGTVVRLTATIPAGGKDQAARPGPAGRRHPLREAGRGRPMAGRRLRFRVTGPAAAGPGPATGHRPRAPLDRVPDREQLCAHLQTRRRPARRGAGHARAVGVRGRPRRSSRARRHGRGDDRKPDSADGLPRLHRTGP